MNTYYCLDDSPRFEMIELNEIDSTNNFLKSYRPLQPKEVTLVTAEFQKNGVRRMKRRLNLKRKRWMDYSWRRQTNFRIRRRW